MNFALRYFGLTSDRYAVCLVSVGAYADSAGGRFKWPYHLSTTQRYTKKAKGRESGRRRDREPTPTATGREGRWTGGGTHCVKRGGNPDPAPGVRRWGGRHSIRWDAGTHSRSFRRKGQFFPVAKGNSSLGDPLERA